ncbi:hypothetical protein LCGC14_3091050, partial [marine sediment metagenome]
VIPPSLQGVELPEQYEKNLTSCFSHKMAPVIRLVETARIPIDESRCAGCEECVRARPAQAATGALWNVGVHRDTFFSPFKCLDKCKELTRQNFGGTVSICGICVSVCPIGQSKG